jgi:hypothetical protein
MRFRLAAGERSSKYRPGQFVSAAYAARYETKVTPIEEYESDYWEVTVTYGDQ